METVRARNGIVFDVLKKYFIDDKRYYTKENYAVFFKVLFKERPDEVFVLVTLDDNKVIGYIIAALHESGNYVWLYMIYADETLPMSEKIKSMTRLELWAENAMNVNEIRGEVYHNFEQADSNYYGFERYSTVVSKMIKENKNG